MISYNVRKYVRKEYPHHQRDVNIFSNKYMMGFRPHTKYIEINIFDSDINWPYATNKILYTQLIPILMRTIVHKEIFI